MNISIFGMGYVGVVSGVCLAKLGHRVIGVDVNPGKVKLINSGISPIVEPGISEILSGLSTSQTLTATDDATAAVRESDISFISVGTPGGMDGVPSMESLDRVVAQLGEAIARKSSAHTVVVRSTVPPGTMATRIAPALSHNSGRDFGEGLELCSNPEFLREGRAIQDFENPPFTLVGAHSSGSAQIMRSIYAHTDAPFIVTDSRMSESIKYLCNIFHAVKIGFANEVGAVLKAVGVDARAAMRVFCEDKVLNISPVYLKPGFAFGGSCLPKDLRAFLTIARSEHVDLPFLGNLLNSNERHIERAFEMIALGGRRKIALFGLAFKHGTDDLRESPLVTLAEKLIGKGYELTVYDHNVELARLTGANKAFIEREIPHIGRLLKPTPHQALEDVETIVVGHIGDSEAVVIAASHDKRPIIDLQGVKSLEQLEGARYQGICW